MAVNETKLVKQLRLRMDAAQSKADGCSPIDPPPIRQWSLLGQLVAFFQKAAADGEPNEYLTIQDVVEKYGSYTKTGFANAMRRGIDAKFFVFKSSKLWAGPRLAEAQIKGAILPKRGGIRRFSTLEKFLVQLKTYPDRLVEVRSAPCATGDFPAFAAYPLQHGMIEVVYLSGKGYVRPTKKLMDDPRFQSQTEVESRVFSVLKKARRRLELGPLRNLSPQEFEFVYEVMHAHQKANSSIRSPQT
jgi:hypothetical protein